MEKHKLCCEPPFPFLLSSEIESRNGIVLLNWPHNTSPLHITERPAGSAARPFSTISRLQIPQPLQKFFRRVFGFWLQRTRHISRRPELLQNSALVLQIRLKIGFRGFDRGMPQPSLNDMRVPARLQKMYGCRVPEAVRGKAFGRDGGTTLGRQAQIFLDDGAYSEPREGTAALVDEEMVGGGFGGLAPVMVFIELQEASGGRPQRRDSLLVALADDGDDSILQIEPANSGTGDLLGSGAGVIEESKDGQVPYSVGSSGRWLSQKGLQFLSVKGLRRPLGNALHGDGQNASGVDFEIRVVEREIFEKGLDGGQPLIARFRRVVPAVCGIFQILKEAKDGFGVQVLDAQRPGARILETEISDQELEGVAVASDGVEAYAFLPTQVGVEEFREMVLEVACH